MGCSERLLRPRFAQCALSALPRRWLSLVVRPQMKRHVLTTIGLAFLLSACSRGGRLVTTEPRVSDVAGRYTFSHSKFGSRVDAEILSTAKEAYIDLKTNGEVVLHKVPIIPESRSQGF